MNGERIKKISFECRPFEKAALDRMLEGRAAQGWKLMDWKDKMIFRAENPEQGRFCSVLDQTASAYDTRPAGETLDYIDYCTAAGWEYVCGMGRWRIFRTRDMEVLPIHSDPSTELRTVWEVSRNGFYGQIFLSGLLVFLIVLLVLGWNWGVMFREFVLPAYVVVILFYLGTAAYGAIRYALWYRAQKRRVARGSPVKYQEKRGILESLGIWRGVLLPAVLVLVACTGLDLINGNRSGIESGVALTGLLPWILLGIVLKKFLLREKKDTETNRMWGPFLLAVVLIGLNLARPSLQDWEEKVVNRLDTSRRVEQIEVDGTTYSFRRDDLPLTLDDLGVSYNPILNERWKREESRALVAYLRCSHSESGTEDGISFFYEVWHSGIPFLFHQCLSEYDWIREQGERIDLSGLSAREVFRYRYGDRLGQDEWLLIYEGTCFLLRTNLELTKDQMVVVEERLLGWAGGETI